MADRSDEERRRLYQLAGTGLEFFSALLAGLLGGYLLDRWLGTTPWLMLVGIGAGFLTGLVRLVQIGKSK